jgi:hypothetical protein
VALTVADRLPPAAIDVFGRTGARVYDEIGSNDPQPFKQRLAVVAHNSLPFPAPANPSGYRHGHLAASQA